MHKDIVLISGALASPKFWHYQEEYFQNRARLHYVDVLSGSSITAIAKQFARVAPNRFTVIGFSMGGYVALELFTLIPNQIEQLILINSAARIVSDKGKLERERALNLIKKGKFDCLINLIFRNSIYDQIKYNDVLPLLQEMAREVGAEKYVTQLNAILNKPDHSALLRTITCPALIIASQYDYVMPTERAEHMVEQIKNSKLIYLQNCGHMAPLEQPELLNKIISDWL